MGDPASLNIAHVNLAKGFSGGEQQTLNLIRSLAEAGCQQTLLARANGPLFAAVGKLGVSCYPLSSNLRGHLLGRLLGKIPRPDLFHAHDGRAVHWCSFHHRVSRTPYVVTRRVDNPLQRNLGTQASYLSAAKVVALSRAIERQVHCLSDRIETTVIPSSFSGLSSSPAAVAAIRNQYPDKFLVGQAGKLITHKGYHITIDAARQLQSREPRLHFLFMGAGDKEQALKAQAEGLSNVTFLGHCSNMGDHLAALDLLVFPSLSEGLGSTILEAMSLDVPVIGSDAGGIPDIIRHQQTGLLVPPGDADALAATIEALYAQPPERERLVAGARDRLPEFSPQAVASCYLELYQDTLQRHGKG